MVKVELSQNQFDALCIFAYNVGIAAFCNSTLLKKVNGKDFLGATEEFGKWVHAGHKVIPGLVNRRKAEALLFNEV
jgi:lysozyme